MGPRPAALGAQAGLQLRPRGRPGPRRDQAAGRVSSQLLDPADAPAATACPGLVFLESRPIGGASAAGRAVAAPGHRPSSIGPGLQRPRRCRDTSAAERVLFALVANRAIAPMSKLSAAEWVVNDVPIPGLGDVMDDAGYRAMDWLDATRGEVQEAVFFAVARPAEPGGGPAVLRHHLHLLRARTPTTRPDWRGERRTAAPTPMRQAAGFRAHGNSKDHRDDLPQIVIGLAVTREGIPVRFWCWPGNTNDPALIRQVKDDMRDWKLGPGRHRGRPRLLLRPTTWPTCAAPAGTTSSPRVRDEHRRSQVRCPARAATSRSRPTCGSRKSASTTPMTGSSSATTPTPHNRDAAIRADLTAKPRR